MQASEAKPRGLVIVISAPSGAGKSTLTAELCKRLPGCRASVSCTTRPPRPGEKEGVDYLFLTEQDFQKKVAQGAFIEWAFVHGHNYGTLREPLERELEAGRDLVLNIDVQGGTKIRQVYPDGIFVFVAPSDVSVLKDRLTRRGQDSPKDIQERLTTARKELLQMAHYDYLVVNDQLPEALKQLEAIVTAEHQRVKRLSHLVEQFQRNAAAI